MSTELTRRSLLGGALAAVAAGGFWWLRERRRKEVLSSLLELARESGLAGGEAGLGRAYLELHPEEADPERLSRLLAPGAAGPESIRSRLAERIGRDWAELDTVQLDGWIVSRTEGRLLAVITLLSARVDPESAG